MNDTELDALTDMVLDRLHHDFDEPHQFSKEERAEMIDAAIEATDIEFGLPPTTNPKGDYMPEETTIELATNFELADGWKLETNNGAISIRGHGVDLKLPTIDPPMARVLAQRLARDAG